MSVAAAAGFYAWLTLLTLTVTLPGMRTLSLRFNKLSSTFSHGRHQEQHRSSPAPSSSARPAVCASHEGAAVASRAGSAFRHAAELIQLYGCMAIIYRSK